MKPIVSLLPLLLMFWLSACTLPNKAQSNAPAQISTPQISDSAPTDADPTLNTPPDFGSMQFVEKNDLYIRLLQEKQNAGAATNQAENEYINFLEASLRNDTMLADEYLQKAIMLLWDL